MTELPPSLGLRHVALWIPDEKFGQTVAFYRDGVGLRVDWQPDEDNVYLSGGPDNLALHRVRPPRRIDLTTSSLDHLGFCVPNAAAVHAWHARLAEVASAGGCEIAAGVRTHRDGATSFYVRDPAGTTVQFIHIPNLLA